MASSSVAPKATKSSKADEYEYGLDDDPETIEGGTEAEEEEDIAADEYDLDVREEAGPLRELQPINLMLGFVMKHSKGQLQLGNIPFEEWTTKQLVKLGALLAPLSFDKTREAKLGKIDISEIEEAESASIAALTCALTEEKPRAVVSVSDGTLPALIFQQKGIVTNGKMDGQMVMLDIPKYDAPDRAKILIHGAGNKLGRCVNGQDYVLWLNSQSKTQIQYEEIPEPFVNLAKIMHRRMAIGLRTDTKGIVFKDKVISSSRMPGAEVLKLSAALQKLVPKLEAAYFEKDLLPTWAPSGKQQLEFLEWFLYKYATKHGEVAALTKLADKCVKMVEEMVPKVKANFGNIMGSNPKEAMITLSSGKFVAPNTKSPLRAFKNILDVVTLSRRQERQGDVSTQKTGGPSYSPAGGVHMVVAAKWHNNLEALADVFPDLPSKVDCLGVGAACHWQSEVMAKFPHADIVYSDIVNYSTPIPGKFLQRDVTDPTSFSPGSGIGKCLLSDVLPGQGPKKCNFKQMHKNYLASDYECGVVKYIMGSDLDEGTLLNGRSAPVFLDEWASKYHCVGLLSGGGSHSPEYFVVFAHRREKGKAWVPPSPFERFGKLVEGEQPSLTKYWATWLLLKAVDVLRITAWKAPYALNGVRQRVPTSVEQGGAFLGWPYTSVRDRYHLTGKGLEVAVTGAEGEEAFVVEDGMFDDFDVKLTKETPAKTAKGKEKAEGEA